MKRSVPVQWPTLVAAGMILLSFLVSASGTGASVRRSDAGDAVRAVAPPLFENLGSWHFPITTRSELAQRYFDQGLRLTYAFNHEEAVNSFQEAARLDPEAGMAYWGVALALGPNINAGMDKAQERRAYEAVQSARRLDGRLTERERGYIAALARRYAASGRAKRTVLDRAYADAMRELARKWPEDADAATLFAESLMDLRPWNYWTEDGRAQPGTDEILQTLEGVLRKNPDHPGACHFYIHAVEASPEPERALDCARRLPALMPGAGHLVHMPAHIYMRLGRYHEAAEQNAHAAQVDRDYFHRRTLTGHYPTGYYGHNLHFLWAALMMEGRADEAVKAARDLVQAIPINEVEKDPAMEVFTAAPLLTFVRFERWSDVLQEAPPPKKLLYTRGIWRFARGIALSETKRKGSAKAEHRELSRLIKSVPKGRMAGLNGARSLLSIAEAMLAAELAFRAGQSEQAVRFMETAIRLEDGGQYTEPPDWPIPIRPILGRRLLELNRAVDAETVFREDLRRYPENRWALRGLAQSLRTQLKNEDADAIDARLANGANGSAGASDAQDGKEAVRSR